MPFSRLTKSGPYSMQPVRITSVSLVVEKEGRLTALIVPDYDQAAQENIDDEGIDKMMAENIKTLNASVAAYEKVACYVIHPTEFEKTPKRSIRRFLYQDLAR